MTLNHKLATKVSAARRVAFQILWQVAQEQAFAANLLASPLTNNLSVPDRALTQELVLGVLRHQQYLDYFWQQISGRNLAKMDLAVIIILRLGTYQLRYLTRIPAHAVVDEAVTMVKASGKTSASGLVNAVLRKIARTKDLDIDAPDEFSRVAIRHSHPEWLLRHWAIQYGLADTTVLAQTNNSAPPISLRLNTLKATQRDIVNQLEALGLQISANPLIPNAFRLVEGSIAQLLELVHQGLIHIQDEASQLVAWLVDAQPGMKVWDVCAAPGGKTTAIANYMQNQGLIVAGDIHLARVKLLKETAQRLGATIIQPICYDACGYVPVNQGQTFDRVLVDAPCTGTGTLRRNPEIKWRLTAAKILELAVLQQQILDNVADQVAVGGKLIYSTCSLEVEENEEVTAKFLANHTNYMVVRPELPPHLLTSSGYLRTWPPRDQMDGFFATILRRTA